MFCESCRVMFAFYLNYCRQCGRKLSERPSLAAADTAGLGSSPRPETGLMATASPYVTAPVTMRIGTPSITISDMVQQVLNNFPSAKTSRMQELGPKTGGAQPLREFSMAEFALVEQTAQLSATGEAFLASLSGEATLELPLPQVADTVPLAPQTIAPTVRWITKSCEFKQAPSNTRARLHLRPTGPQLALNLPAQRGRLGARFLAFFERALENLLACLTENLRFKNF